MSQRPPQSSRQLTDPKLSALKRVRRLSYILDDAIRIPGTRYSIGLDPILGLVPGAGDFIGTLLSAYIVLEAARLGLPRGSLIQMVSNILFETVIGTVPVVGDLVDITWKANHKNIELLEQHLGIPQPRQKPDWLFLTVLLGGLLLIVMIIAAVSVAVLRWLVTAIVG
ncbi:MAG TPA: DUF4112 domain-containing protein [Coleofasciculaceae cyanobacterium]